MSVAAAVRTRRVVTVTRPTDYELLHDLHGTRGQLEFVLTSRGSSLDALDRRHQLHLDARHTVRAAIPISWRRATLDRSELDRFLFEPDDIIVIVGQDGLVANVAKYLDGQPVVGVDPEPGRNPGRLVTYAPNDLEPLLTHIDRGTAPVLERTMIAATLDDGRQLTALNDIFVGQRSHQSARYTLTIANSSEHHSSSGLIVTTGTGATGWAASIHRACRSRLPLPSPTDPTAAMFVREPWPSPTTGTELTEAVIEQHAAVTIRSHMDTGGTIFGDGIEADPLPFDTGRHCQITIADRTFHHITPAA